MRGVLPIALLAVSAVTGCEPRVDGEGTGKRPTTPEPAAAPAAATAATLTARTAAASEPSAEARVLRSIAAAHPEAREFAARPMIAGRECIHRLGDPPDVCHSGPPAPTDLFALAWTAGGAEERGGGGERVLTANTERIRSVIGARRSKIKNCFTAERTTEIGDREVIAVSWTVGDDGQVNDARVVGSSLVDDRLTACVLDLVSEGRFFAPKGVDNIHVVYPFEFLLPHKARWQ